MLKVRSDLLRFKNVFSQIVYRIYVPVDKSLKSRGISFQSVIHVIRALLKLYYFFYIASGVTYKIYCSFLFLFLVKTIDSIVWIH